MLSLLVTIAFIIVWTLPWCRKAKPEKNVTKKMLIGFLLCMTVGILAAMLITGRAEKLLGLFLAGPAYDVIDLLIVGIVEEGLKCFIAVLLVRKLEHVRTIDYVLIFGMVGAGFTFTETGLAGLISDGSVILLLIRGILANHIFYLYYSGFGYAASRQTGRHIDFYRNVIITMLLHFIFDLGITVIEWDYSASDYMIIFAFAFTAFALIANIVLLIKVIRKLNNCCKENSVKENSVKENSVKDIGVPTV